MKAVKITTDGGKEVVELEYGEVLRPLQEAVGGYIELISLRHFVADMWVNEDGKMHHLAPNPVATQLWARENPNAEKLLGDVIVTGPSDEHGETLGLMDDQVAFLLAL